MVKQELETILNRFISADYDMHAFLVILKDLEDGYYMNEKEELGDRMHFINQELTRIVDEMRVCMGDIEKVTMRME